MIKRIAKVIVILIFVIGLNSCVSDESKIKESIETSFKMRMNDPESFELVDFQLFDTISDISLDYKQKIDNKKGREAFNEFIKIEGEYIVNQFIKIEGKFVGEYIVNDKSNMFRVEVVIRGSNAFGAKIRNEYLVDVLNDKDFTVLRTMTREESLEEAMKGISEYYKNKK